MATSPRRTLPVPPDRSAETSSLPFRIFNPGRRADDRSTPPPPKPPADPRLQLSLTQLYEQHFLPKCRCGVKGGNAKTIKQERETLGYWAELTGDPPLSILQADLWRTLEDDQAATADDAASTAAAKPIWIAFVERLQRLKWRGKPRAANTIIKHCVHLQRIIDLAGPRNRENRLGMGLFRDRDGHPIDAPYFERPRKKLKVVTDTYTWDEMDRWLEACQHARQTANLLGTPAAVFHRSLALWTLNTGLRIETTMLATLDMLAPDSFIEIPPEIYKGGAHGHLMYVNRAARDALAALEPYRGKSRALFPWDGWPASQGWLRALIRDVQEAAGVYRPDRAPMHGLRKTLITWLAEQNAIVASLVAGHRGGNVTRDHYVNARRVIPPWMNRFPQPTPLRQQFLEFAE